MRNGGRQLPFFWFGPAACCGLPPRSQNLTKEPWSMDAGEIMAEPRREPGKLLRRWCVELRTKEANAISGLDPEGSWIGCEASKWCDRAYCTPWPITSQQPRRQRIFQWVHFPEVVIPGKEPESRSCPTGLLLLAPWQPGLEDKRMQERAESLGAKGNGSILCATSILHLQPPKLSVCLLSPRFAVRPSCPSLAQRHIQC
jgi:hypothetical protein